MLNELTCASLKRSELIYFDLFKSENCRKLFIKGNANLSETLKTMRWQNMIQMSKQNMPQNPNSSELDLTSKNKRVLN